uniref:Anion transporter n=1 Tax=Gracilinema caldarium TaxID=215591 RepID=A0A7C3E7R9_9SPIR
MLIRIEQVGQTILVDGVILLALIGIAIGRIPRLRMNRAAIAFAGAAFLIALGGLSAEEAAGAIDLSTLILILSMMIITANLKFSGFFDLAGNLVLRAADRPRKLLGLVMASSAVLSALFLNDTICIMMTPLVAVLCQRSKRDPVPYLIALALAANIGSAATIIGNPQNMLIGASSGIPFGRFLSRLAIPSVLGLLVAYLLTILVFKKEFAENEKIILTDLAREGFSDQRLYKPLLYKSLFAILVMIIAFFLNAPVYAAAMVAAALLLTTRRIRPERVFAELDWTIIAFFGGLFIITAAVAKTEAFAWFVAKALPLVGQSMAGLSAFTLVLSNLISNVPAVMLMRPLAQYFADTEKFYLVLAMASTYAGNLTLLGSVANLIVAESAKRFDIDISFGTYLKVGLPTTLVTIMLGTLYLMFT